MVNLIPSLIQQVNDAAQNESLLSMIMIDLCKLLINFLFLTIKRLDDWDNSYLRRSIIPVSASHTVNLTDSTYFTRVLTGTRVGCRT